MKKKLGLMLFVVCSLTLVACGTKNTGSEDKKEKLIVGTEAGFAPYESPKMSIVTVTPDVSHIYGNGYLSGINRRISSQISKKYFEIYK